MICYCCFSIPSHTQFCVWHSHTLLSYFLRFIIDRPLHDPLWQPLKVKDPSKAVPLPPASIPSSLRWDSMKSLQEEGYTLWIYRPWYKGNSDFHLNNVPWKWVGWKKWVQRIHMVMFFNPTLTGDLHLWITSGKNGNNKIIISWTGVDVVLSGSREVIWLQGQLNFNTTRQG